MSALPPADRDRLRSLLADEALDQLSVEDRTELDELRGRAAEDPSLAGLVAELVVALDRAEPNADGSANDGAHTPDEMPRDLRDRLVARGAAIVGGPAGGQAAATARRFAPFPWLALAAVIGIAVVGGILALSALDARDNELVEVRATAAALQRRVASNDELLASSRAELDQLRSRLDGRDATIEEQESMLAAASARELELAEALADATDDLEAAELAIARYEAPPDPEVLAANRRKLLDVPDTIRIAWQPFDLPDAPAEQRQVRGDVVWNDELGTGYLRFEGLAVNDPSVEQYQVWVIDERGMEQKVSGGVFDATVEGEVIVPIQPGIDVRRVALFAITIEEPGGTWVPDLSRRVTVAPRETS